MRDVSNRGFYVRYIPVYSKHSLKAVAMEQFYICMAETICSSFCWSNLPPGKANTDENDLSVSYFK